MLILLFVLVVGIILDVIIMVGDMVDILYLIVNCCVDIGI